MNIRCFFFRLAIAALGANCSAGAAIVYSGLQNISIPTDFDGVFLDVDTGATGTTPITGWDINPFFGGVGIGNSAPFQPVRIGTGNLDAYKNLAFGAPISAGSSFYSSGDGGSDTDHFGAGADQFHDGVDGYLGFQFTTNSTTGPYFGWMRLSLTDNTEGALIRDWAYDDSGADIFAGMVVPEPTRVILLLAGCLAIVMRRRACAPTPPCA